MTVPQRTVPSLRAAEDPRFYKSTTASRSPEPRFYISRALGKSTFTLGHFPANRISRSALYLRTLFRCIYPRQLSSLPLFLVFFSDLKLSLYYCNSSRRDVSSNRRTRRKPQFFQETIVLHKVIVYFQYLSKVIETKLLVVIYSTSKRVCHERMRFFFTLNFSSGIPDPRFCCISGQ